MTLTLMEAIQALKRRTKMKKMALWESTNSMIQMETWAKVWVMAKERRERMVRKE